MYVCIYIYIHLYFLELSCVAFPGLFVLFLHVSGPASCARTPWGPVSSVGFPGYEIYKQYIYIYIERERERDR